MTGASARAVLGRYLTVAVLVRLADEGARVALVLLALTRTSNAAFGGALVAALMVPHVVAAPAMGALADRVRRRRLLYVSSVTAFGLSLGACAVLAGRAPTWAVLLVAVAGGCFAPLLTGGLTGLLRDLVVEQQRPRAYGLDAVSYNVAGICGPAVAALLVAVAGAGTATVAVAGSAVAGGLLLASLPIAGRPGSRPSDPAQRFDGSGHRARTSMWHGVAAMWRNRTLLAVTVASSVGSLGFGALPLVAALFAVKYHAGYVAGALLSAEAAGGLLGSLGYARWPVGSDRPERVVMVATLATGVPLLLIPLVSGVPIVLVLFAVSGFFSGPQISALFASRDREAPPEAHTQVFTLGAGLKITAAALGAAIGGAVAEAGGGAGALMLGVAASQLLGCLIGGCLIGGGSAGGLLTRGTRPRGQPEP